MFLLLGGTLLRKGDFEQAMELLLRVRDAVPYQDGPCSVEISLVRTLFRVPGKTNQLNP